MAKKKNLLVGLPHVHPGSVLREDALPHANATKTAIADALGISRAQPYAILSEDVPITAVIARRFGKPFGTAPEIWLNVQSNYDIETLGPRMKGQLDAIPCVEAA